MNNNKLVTTALTATLALGLSSAWANGTSSPSVILRGNLSGHTGASNVLSTGEWLTADGGDATIQTPGAVIRIQAGASVRLDEVQAQSSKLAARGGKVFVKVAEGSRCVVAAGNKSVESTTGEFLVDAKAEPRCYSVSGNLQAHGPAPTASHSWKSVDKTLALDGPDVRKRNNKRRRFTQGEENKGKRIGEDLPPSRTPAPTVTESPAYTPSYTPTPTPPQTPPPTPNNPPPTVVEGGSPWPLIGGLIGAGGLAYFISTRGNDNTPNNIVRPFSP